MRSLGYCHETLTLVIAGEKDLSALPFAGQYRTIDSALYNCVNSGLRRIYVLNRRPNFFLDHHLGRAWNFFLPAFDEFILPVNYQCGDGGAWYRGSADAIFQNIHLFIDRKPKRILVIPGEQICRMNYSEIIAAHIHTGAAVTVVGVEADLNYAWGRGIIETDKRDRITRYWQIPSIPITGKICPDRALVNMGIYVFETGKLIDALYEDALRESTHDLGGDLLPEFLASGQAFVHRLSRSRYKRYHYWRDLSTIDSYYQGQMDLIASRPRFSLSGLALSSCSNAGGCLPAPIYRGLRPLQDTPAIVCGSLISSGCATRGSRIVRSILSPRVRVNRGAVVEESILFEGVEIGSQARIRRTIVDNGVKIPPRFVAGYDVEEDRRRFPITEAGIVIVSQNGSAEISEAMMGNCQGPSRKRVRRIA